MDYVRKQGKNRLLLGSLLLLSLLMNVPLPGQAQQTQPYQGVLSDPRKPPARQNSQYYTEDLKTAPDLPFVPTYTGKGALLTSGLYYPRLQNGRCYHLRWQAKEDSRIVLNWYRSVLESNGWTIVPNQSNEKTLAATREKEGLTILLMVQPPSYAGYSCGFLLRYLEVAPKIAGR